MLCNHILLRVRLVDGLTIMLQDAYLAFPDGFQWRTQLAFKEASIGQECACQESIAW